MCSDGFINWRIRKYGRRTENGWEVIHEETGPINLILLPKMSVLILQNASVLESVSLLTDTAGKIKGFLNEDVLMFVINDRKPPRKFRVLFARENNTENLRQPSWDCANALRMYFPIVSSTNKETLASIQVTTLSEMFENILTFEKNDARDLEQLSTNESLTESALDNVVRLCLLDSTFPTFISSVERSLNSIMKPEKTMNQ